MPAWGGEIAYRDFPGEKIWIELSAYPIKDEQGHVTSVIEYVKDITFTLEMPIKMPKVFDVRVLWQQRIYG